MINKSMKLLCLALFAIVVTGCASTSNVSYEEKQAIADEYVLPETPGDNESLVYVLRPSVIGGAVRFKIFLDGKRDEGGKYIGHNRGRQYVVFPVEPGSHTIYSKAENWVSAGVTVAKGDAVFLQQTAAVGFFIARNAIGPMDPVEAKYLLSLGKMEPGTLIDSE